MSDTHVGPLPLEGEGRRLVVEDGGLRGREVRVLPQLPLLQALLPQLLEAPHGRRHRGAARITLLLVVSFLPSLLPSFTETLSVFSR